MKNQLPSTRRGLIKTGALLAGSLAAENTLGLIPAPQTTPRVIFVYVPGGAIPEYWYPHGCADHFALNEMTAPFEPVKQHCVFLQGINLIDYGHGNIWRQLNPQFNHGETLDIRLAKHFGGELPLSLSATPSESLDSMTYSTELGSIPPASNMQTVFNELFAETQLTSPLYDHFAQQDLAADARDFETQSRHMLELTVLALQHNKTQVASLLLGDDQGTFSVPSLGFNADYEQAIHAMATPKEYIALRKFLSARVAYLIQLLAATPDSSGVPLIESTLVVQFSNMGDGRSSSNADAPVMLAGGKRYIKNGLVVRPPININTQNEVLDTVSAAFGLTENGYGSGPISSLLL